MRVQHLPDGSHIECGMQMALMSLCCRLWRHDLLVPEASIAHERVSNRGRESVETNANCIGMQYREYKALLVLGKSQIGLGQSNGIG